MLRRFSMVLLLTCMADISFSAVAGIPEPDVVLYGRMCVDGAPRLRADSDVVVTASIDVGGKAQVVGRYRMGDNERAGNLYVLRIQRESGADGSQQSPNAARADQQIRLNVQVGNETAIDAGAFTLDAAGSARRLDLDVGVARGLDADSDADLTDFAILQRCYTGSGAVELGSECATADRDGDSDVDLVDSQALINEVAGPCG